MRKKTTGCILAAVIFLTGCTAAASNTQDLKQPEDKTTAAVSSEAPAVPETAGTFEPTRETADQLLRKAFSYDGSAASPTVEQNETQTFFRYEEAEPYDMYLVEFTDGWEYPMTLYHFCHSNQDEQADLAADEEFQLNKGFIAAARAFVQSVYGADCSDAEARAYGYANKISVQLAAAEDCIFQVRFYYQDIQPVGVLYFTDAQTAQQAMERNSARILYP